MPASAQELRQLRDFARAIVQLVEAIEARERAEAGATAVNGAPTPRPARIR